MLCDVRDLDAERGPGEVAQHRFGGGAQLLVGAHGVGDEQDGGVIAVPGEPSVGGRATGVRTLRPLRHQPGHPQVHDRLQHGGAVDQGPVATLVEDRGDRVRAEAHQQRAEGVELVHLAELGAQEGQGPARLRLGCVQQGAADVDILAAHLAVVEVVEDRPPVRVEGLGQAAVELLALAGEPVDPAEVSRLQRL